MTTLHQRNGGQTVDTQARGCPAPAVRVSRPWWVRAWRGITRPLLRFYLSACERSVREERKGYAARGVQMGPVYLKNCHEQERDLRNRLSKLDLE